MRFKRQIAESLDVLIYALNAMFDNGLEFTVVSILKTEEGYVALLDFYERTDSEWVMSA